MDIIRITGELPADIDELAPFGAVEGVATIDTVREEWASGANRFDKPGEALLAVRVGDCLAGIGGITRDYNFPDALRMRRFYIHRDFRGQGAGRLMADWLLAHARHYTSRVTLRAGSEAAARFWEHLGFTPVPLDTHTHELRF